MPALPRLRPSTTRLAAGLAALAAVSATLAGATPALSTSATTATVTAAKACIDASSGERLAAGSTVVDPNSLNEAEARRAETKLQKRMATNRSLGRSSSPSRQIDVYVHVIETKKGKGGVSKTKIKNQIKVLNAAYAGKTSPLYSVDTGFTFKLKKIDHTKNSDWYDWSLPDEEIPGSESDDVNAKTKLHKGTFDDLNLYFASLSDGLLGYATFPWATTVAQDGVVVLNTSVPGGKTKHYNQGDTATHEVGHWLGLFHTFQNNCEAPGDYVDDTPAQDYVTSDFSTCDADTDTCADDPGNDPVYNFMNYSDDACMNRFTAGQKQRMIDVWNAYRVPASPTAS